ANPSDPPRDADQLRGYLRRWLAPAIRQWVQQAAAGTMV
ncbi:TetR/AcrR family transcriptional regulator, partial [Mycobacterium avium]|nr:TetR/AcrR family transcriptional regulator [Mycobacterium avium]